MLYHLCMNAATSPFTDPIAIVQQLDPEAIRKRIDALDGEREALLVLLRAAQRIRRKPASEREVADVG